MFAANVCGDGLPLDDRHSKTFLTCQFGIRG
jgi:hypothetical protein